MMQTFDEVSKFGKDFVDGGLKSFAALSKGAQAIAVETADYAKKSMEAGSATFERVISSGSVEKAVEVQADYARLSYEGFVAETAKLGDLYAELAKEVYKPFEAIVARAK